MTMKVLGVLCLALVLGACESISPETKPEPSPAAQATPAQAPSPSAEATVAAPTAWKVGDKVKATINGAPVDATIVSIDEKAAKATIKVQGEAKERTVNLSEIVKQ